MRKTKNLVYLILFTLLIIGYYFPIKIYAATSYKAKTYIDSPVEKMLVHNEFEIEGWLMSDDESATIKAYIDDKEVKIEKLDRKERIDVLNAITGYGTAVQNPKPGYIMKINCQDISDGDHKLEIKIISRTGVELATAKRNINFKKFVAKTYIDMPNNSREYTIKDELEIKGWAMSNDKNYNIEAYINGEKQEIKDIQRIQRPDVINAIKGYGTIEQNPNPGYTLRIDTSKITSGSYNLQVKIVSSEGKILDEVNKTMVIQRYTSRMYIDSPINNKTVKPDFIINGWMMTDDEKAKINVYIDGTKQTIKQITKKERPDVINAIQGYGGIEKNPNPGFELKLDSSNISDGRHTLKLEIISREGNTLSTATRTINYENYKAKTYIDKITSLGETINVEGWGMSDDKNYGINVYIDGTKQTIKQITRKERPDVINAIKGYGGIEENPNPGYNIEIDVSSYKDKSYLLKLEIVSSLGQVIATHTRNFTVDKYNAYGYIDNPTSMSQAKNNLYVSGWIMSTDENVQIKAYINDRQLEMKDFERIERNDVLNAIAGYGGANKNPKPGYKANIDISGYDNGKYTLRIDAISREGEIMYSSSRTIVIYNKYSKGIDVSKHNNTIDWTKVKQAGVEFAMIRAGNRGYGQEGNLVEDPRFVENMRGAISNGIEVGVYIYSQAITENEAIEEADLAVRLIRENGFSNNITYPIVIDTESSSGRADSLTREQRTIIVKAFCERIKQHGYTPMIYANKWWLESSLDMNQLNGYDVWVAQYTGTTDPINNNSSYNGRHEIWQYTDKGTIDGISGNVDLNICYKKYF